MKKTNKENVLISSLIEKELNISFTNYEFELDKWGHADNYCQLNEETIIFLECEKGQKHPNTNVLKYWPYLETHSNLKVILFQYFFPENKAPKNRIALCDFLRIELEMIFLKRFQYIRLSGNYETISHQLTEKKKGLTQLLLTEKVERHETY